MITEEVAESIETSVLCWLATVAEDGSPNVSPKEAFMHDGSGRILVAHIASPQTVRNIESDARVCLSFIDVFTQKGHKVRGTARVLRESDEGYEQQKFRLTELIGDRFRILAVIEVEPTEVEEIVAPSYRMFSEMTANKMIGQSLATYKVGEYRNKAE
ncbi:MAG: pyridoxamine 5'-phosphate oxidase family protein [Planctomycetales bacterium]|nr:pyridoxamine 5'-phosphate oxidase family protein [Planctomycetales bacterium]